MANIVIFQGVEVTLPLDVSFNHREGCLEIDLTGMSGKLLLRPGTSHTLPTGFTSASYLVNDHRKTKCFSEVQLPVVDRHMDSSIQSIFQDGERTDGDRCGFPCSAGL